MKLEVILATLPQIQPDLELVFPLFVQAYEESALVPIIQREYGSKLAFDKEAHGKEMNDIKSFTE